jgi:hypothetical protein
MININLNFKTTGNVCCCKMPTALSQLFFFQEKITFEAFVINKRMIVIKAVSTV